MRKLVHRLTVLWLSLLLCFIGLMGNSYAGSIKTVVIDAGHGGHDPGAIGKSNTCEKDINLKLALKVGKLIEENFKDIKVVYTAIKMFLWNYVDVRKLLTKTMLIYLFPSIAILLPTIPAMGRKLL